VTPRGDDDTGMTVTHYIHDEVVEAVIRGDAVPEAQTLLASFAHQVRALGDEPVPAPSSELTAVLAGHTAGVAGPGGRSGRNSMPAIDKPASLVAKVAGLGVLAKLGLGASLAAAGVVGAGAAGVLPSAADHAVRHAIEAVTPVDFAPPAREHPDNFGSRVSSDATGESDGVHGVDGPSIADDAPGAANRPDPPVADEPPGQSGETGLTRANQTPAAPQAPDEPSGQGSDAGDEGELHRSGNATPPTTTPARGGQAPAG
jgi:hypothetical protein